MREQPLRQREDRASAQRLRRRLQEATRADHERLDGRFEAMFGAAEPVLYHRFIRMNHACHAAIEPELGPFAFADRLDLTPALGADLAAMGLSRAPAEAFPVRDAAEAAGAVYVLDGARLGARYMQKAFHADPPAWAGAGVTTAYLDAAAAPDPFAERMAEAARMIEGDDELERATVSACRAFALFEATLDRIEAGAVAGADAA